MEARPKINIERTLTDALLEVAGVVIIAATWLVAVWGLFRLPAVIPVHFRLNGEADRYGCKAAIIILPVIGTLLFGGLTWLNRFPHVFNYPVTITAENARVQYTMATRLLRVVKTLVAVLFLTEVVSAIMSALHRGSAGWWLTVAEIALIFVPVVYYMVRAVRHK